ncbi:hypothetical protein Bca52824_014187 [Brassica carinata]|uniref:Uncharacterized protein n=1 Tax=Brassica carinata TaxID=52824 RepID=A0A8X7W0L5_BRACI|nr:hypothetical protein Bca52824_014187 [Brassica carinata]
MIETNMLLHTVSSSSPPLHSQILSSPGSFKFSPKRFLFSLSHHFHFIVSSKGSKLPAEFAARGLPVLSKASLKDIPIKGSTFLLGQSLLIISANPQLAAAAEKAEPIYEVGELFELSIQLSYLLLLLGLLGVGTFYVIRQVLVRRELDLSAKELQEQVRSGDASATELFELGAVMLRRKFYPAANKFCFKPSRNGTVMTRILLRKGIAQFEMAVKLQPGYVTAWNNLGDAYEQKKELPLALKAFEEVLLFDPNNKVARPRRDALKDRVKLYKGVVAVKSKKR